MAAARWASSALWVACAVLLQRRAAALSTLDPSRGGAVPSPRRPEHLSLLGISSATATAEAGSRAEAAADAAKAAAAAEAGQAADWSAVPPSWFNSESMESSADPAVGGAVETGWEPPFRHPGDGTRSQVKSPKWFHESESGGDKSAWQTHYPEAKNEFHHSQTWQVLGYQQWEYTPEGWLNDPKPDWLMDRLQHQPGTKDADWFDTAAGTVDIYGRRVPPSKNSAKWLLAQPEEPAGNRWIERAINTTILCSTPGCTGRSSLQAYNPKTEEGRFCRLNIGVHPTDFDDDYDSEPIDLWVVNGYGARSKCDPMARGCNATASRPLYSCLRELDVDHVVDPSKGSMVVEGRLNKMVDECPYNGNFLSAVAVVTCLVRGIPEVYAASHGVPLTSSGGPYNSAGTEEMEPFTVSAELMCDSPGCQNLTTFYVNPTVAFYGGTCTMDVVLDQTDFDDSTYSSEFVEFLGLKGYGNLSSGSIFPGKNPCNEEYAGMKVPASHTNYTVATGIDVTENVLKGNVGLVGTLQIEGKISDMVDECAVDGKWLLHATAKVTCIPKANMSAAEEAAAVKTAAELDSGEHRLPWGRQDQEGIETPGHILAKKLRQRSALVNKPTRV